MDVAAEMPWRVHSFVAPPRKEMPTMLEEGKPSPARCMETERTETAETRLSIEMRTGKRGKQLQYELAAPTTVASGKKSTRAQGREAWTGERTCPPVVQGVRLGGK